MKRHTALLVAAILAQPLPAVAAAPDWQPAVSEKLVKLPNAYLKKELDKDFANSPLAGALADATESARLKAATLADLNRARGQATGDLRVELDHQFLAEKKAYLDLVAKQQDLKRRQLTVRAAAYERLLSKLGLANSGQTKDQAKLVEQQVAARARFEKSEDRVDLTLFEESVAPDSKYARDYAKNLSAIKQLAAAIDNHAMTRKAQAEAVQGESKPSYLRRLIADTEADLALLNQESEIVGYMAKLVSLDAQALAEDVQDSHPVVEDAPKDTGLASVVNLYIQ